MTGNVIYDDYYGIFEVGPVTVAGAASNHFLSVTTPIGTYPTYSG